VGEVRLSIGPAGCGKTRLAVDRFLAALTQSNPAELLWDTWPRFLFLVPDAEGARSVRLALLAEPRVGGLVGPLVLTFNGLYELIFHLAGKSSPQPLSDVARLTLLRRVLQKLAHEGGLRLFAKSAPLAGATEPGVPLYTRPGFVRALDGFIQELKQGAKEPADFSRALDAFGRDDRSRDLEAVYACYQETLTEHGLYDAAGVSWYARDLLPVAFRGCPALGLLVADGFLTFTPTQLAILKELASRSSATLLTLTYEEDPGRQQLYHHTARTYRLLREQLQAVPERLSRASNRPATLSHLERNVFRWEGADAVEPDPDALCILEAPGDWREALAVAREVKSLVTTGYCLPSEILILCRSLARQGATLSRACAQLGVPVQVRPHRSLLQVPVVTALLKALRVATEDWPRTLVGDVLASPYFRLKGRGPDAEVDVEGMASEAFIVGGRETWFDRLRRLEEGLTVEAGEGTEDAEEAPEVSRRRRKRAAERAQACAHVRERAAALAEALGHVSEEGRVPAERVREFVVAARRLIDDLELPQGVLGGDAEQTRRDVMALGQLDEVLSDLSESLPAANALMSLPEFLEELTLALGETMLQEGPVGSDAVRLLEVHEARGVQAPVAFVVGLIEGLFPTGASARPFYGEGEREQLNAQGLGLEQQEDAECREVFLFYTAVTRATRRLYLTYPATDSRGKAQLRSHFVDEVEELLSGRGATSLGLVAPFSQDHPEHGQSVAPGPLGRGAGPCHQRVRLADWPPALAEVACAQELLERWTAGASQQPGRLKSDLVAARVLLAEENPRALGAVFDGATQVRHREGPDHLDCYDGVLARCGGWVATGTMRLLAEEFSPRRLYSASQFDRYARCPFAFYLEYLLGVEPPQPPLERMEPVEIGSICHQALAQVQRRCTQVGRPVRDNLEYATRVLEEVLEQLFGEELLARLGIGRDLAEVYRSETFELLKPILSLEPKPGLVPRRFELAFGEMRSSDLGPASQAEPLTLNIGQEGVRVRGRIDRVDVGPDSYIILDYKLGQAPGARALREGSHVQLSLYLAAGEQVLFPESRCEAAGFVSLSQARVTLPICEQPANQRAVSTSEAKRLAAEYVAAYVHAMRRGLFPPLPVDDHACAMCAFASCCRREHARVERKLGPGGRAGLLALPVVVEENPRP